MTACRAALTDITALKRSETMLGLLARASVVLSSLRDVDAIAEVAGLLSPVFVDVCLVDVFQRQGALRRLGRAGIDARSGHGASLDGESASTVDERGLQARVLRTGKPVVIPTPREVAREEPKLEDLLRGASSVLCVPLLSRGRTLGALTLAMTRSGRSLADTDLAFAQDLASRMAAAVENATLYRDAQQATKARDDVLAVVSHDLRTPASAIALAAKAFEETGASVDPVATRLVQSIERGVERMSRMIDDLLDASSIDEGRLALDLGDHGLDALLDQIVEDLTPIARAEGFRLASGRVSSDARVRCDRERILQVFSNLVGNAIKFAPKGSSIAVGSEVRERDINFFVQDSGPGIDQILLPHLFERYSQAAATARRGRGLGLYICKGIVEAHGGAIRAETAPGQGTTISFTVPRARPPGTRLQASRPRRAGVVLVVDDDTDHREVLRVLLKAAGYAVEEAEDGQKALQRIHAKKRPPALILLDLQMPGMDGWEVMAELKKDPALASIPVLLVSGYPNLGAEAEALRADGYLRKPVRPGQLLEAIERYAQPAAPTGRE